MSTSHKSFQLNTFELPRRAGEMKEYSLDIQVNENFGVNLISVPAGQTIEVDARLESVTEGILLSADVYAVAKGECIRELYNYEPTNERGKKKKHDTEIDDLDHEDELMMQGQIMDLETPIRDAVVLSLPINPLCKQDCLGLCPECGEKWAVLAQDHAHTSIDARWAGLKALGSEDPDFKI